MNFIVTTYCTIAVLAASSIYAAVVKNGEKIAFLGDSITRNGASCQTGYVNLVASGLKANGIDVKLVKAGIGGHKSNQMLARLERDVLKMKPDWMLLSCGVNDVWHDSRGVPLETYKKNITQIVNMAQTAGIKVMILTATMIKEDANNKFNEKLSGYNVFLRKLAKEKKCLLADLNADMQNNVAKMKASGCKGNILTCDGVHMNPFGDKMMALGILRAFGFNETEMEKAEAVWQREPVVYTLRPYRIGSGVPSVEMTLEEAWILQSRACEAGKSYDQYLKEIIQKSLNSAIAKEITSNKEPRSNGL